MQVPNRKRDTGYQNTDLRRFSEETFTVSGVLLDRVYDGKIR